MELIPEKIKVESNSIAIIGWEDGGPGQVHSWFERVTNYKIACFVNVASELPNVNIEFEKSRRESQNFSYPTESSFKDKPLITSRNWADVLINLGINKVLVMTADNKTRLENIQLAQKKNLELISAIHPTAIILDDSILHKNVIIYAGAIIGYKAEIHCGVVINTGAQIDHHNVIYQCASIDPGVVTAGNVTVEQCATVHTGARIKNKIRIGANSIVGAGAVIIRDVPKDETVVGVPGRIKHKN